MTYSEKLKDPRWQKKRLEILERDGWACQICGDSENPLHVHHRIYIKGNAPWDYDADSLVTLCEVCHEYETHDMDKAADLISEAFKKKFFAGDLLQISLAVDSMELLHMSDVVASAISDIFKYQNLQKLVIDLYFHRLNVAAKAVEYAEQEK